MVALVFFCVWDLLRMFAFEQEDDHIVESKVTGMIICVYYLILATFLFFSRRGDERLIEHFGFFRGAASKCLFYLFCTSLIFPLDATGSAGKVNLVVGYIFLVISVVQCIQYCKGRGGAKEGKEVPKDTDNKEPLMEAQTQNQNSNPPPKQPYTNQ